MQTSLADLWESVGPAAVRLKLHGTIRLKGWKSLRAEEVIHHRRGFVWRARVGAFISGSDAMVDGRARMKWNLLGLIPVMSASGPDLARSAIGRWLIESIWLPTMLLPESGAVWTGSSVALERFGESGTLSQILDDRGRLKEVRMLRWGNPGGDPFDYCPFGGIVEEERTFDGFTIPSRLRVGWHFGTGRWSKGEFLRVTIDEAIFR